MFTVRISRITGFIFPILFGAVVEVLQYYGYHAFGDTFDVLDLFAYGFGVLLGFLIDIVILDKLEK